MFLLEAYDIEKQYGNRTILKFPELRIYRGDRIGIVGENGAGKTTLLKILSGEIQPDSGRVIRHTKIHYLKQFGEVEEKLSGGENQKREVLLLKKNLRNLIFADEPTANLDSDGRKWLESELDSAETIVMVSHDRTLLDKLCTIIIEVKDGGLEFYTGNYTDYTKQLENAKLAQAQEYHDYVQKKEQMERAIERKQQSITRSRQGFNKSKIKNESEARLGKYRIQETYKKKQQELKTLRKREERIEAVSRPTKDRRIKIDFSKTDPPQNKRIIYSDSLSFSYGEDSIFNNAKFEILREEKLAICGGNGAGKTTLLNEIFRGNSEINIAPKVKIGYLRQNFSEIDMDKTVLENVLESSVQTPDVVYSVLAGLMFIDRSVEKKAEVVSGGERFRLALAKLIVSDINTLFLDEPTNFLDIPSINALEMTLKDYPGSVVIVSHDESFVKNIADRKLLIKNKKIEEPYTVKPKTKVNKLMLEIRRTQVVEAISSAPDLAKKQKLEKEYNDIMEQLNSAH